MLHSNNIFEVMTTESVFEEVTQFTISFKYQDPAMC